jgi:hypothetical protein
MVNFSAFNGNILVKIKGGVCLEGLSGELLKIKIPE